MPLKINNLKYLINSLFICFLFTSSLISAQEIITDEIKEDLSEASNTETSFTTRKIDGVAAVVGDHIVLESDIDKAFLEIEAQGGDTKNITRCQLFGKLLEDKLYAHHAVQDSLETSEVELQSYVDGKIAGFKAQLNGSLDQVLKFYNKEDEQALRAEIYKIIKTTKLSEAMQRKVVEDLEVTPEEVRQFFNAIPKEEIPTFGTELKVAQIVLKPEVSETEKQRVINQLKSFKKDVQEKGVSFLSRVILHTDDIASKRTGGLYTLNRKRPQMVKEFREVAFSLQEGEISEPFATEYGYHIVYLEKVRGQEYDVRHILLIPKISEEAKQKAKEKMENVRKQIMNKEISFNEAALKYSQEKETKYQGGKLINPETQDYNFELTRMPPEIYAQIQELKENEISEVIEDQDRTGKIKYKILTVSDRINEHKADYARDYLKIKELALNKKRFKTIEKWQDEKIKDTYIKISNDHKNCDFSGNWLKK